VTREGTTVEKLVGTRVPVDANLRMAMDTLDRIARSVVEHPTSTLRIELSNAVVDPRGGLTAVVALHNRGGEPTLFRSPFDLLAGDSGWLTLELWPDKPSAEVASGDVSRVSVSKIEGVDPPDPTATTKQVLTLGPTATLSFRIRAKLAHPKAGPSLVRLAYASFAGGAALVGEVVSKPAKVDVPPEASR
jgi:hypothetical protein